MSKLQGDGYKTWTDTEMNKRISEHTKKWDKIIRPYYDSLVNNVEKEYRLEDAGNYEVYIRTRQFNEVECTGKTNFWLGTLKKEDYRITETVYCVLGLTIDKGTREEDEIGYKVFTNKDEANDYFKQLKEYLR